MQAARQQIHRDELDQTLGVNDPFAYARCTGRDALEERFRRYAESLPRDASGALAGAILRDRFCPLCNSDESRLLFEKYGFPIHACRICSFIFARPMLDPLFTTTEPGRAWAERMSADHLTFIQQPVYQQCARRRFEFELQQVLACADFPAEPGRFIEIGASIGLGLQVAREYGFEVSGVEPDRLAYEQAKASGAKLYPQKLETADLPPASFDVAMSLDVLEHVPEPLDFLIHIRKILRPGGLVAIQVPNAAALITHLEWDRNQIFNGLIHLNYFDPASLDQLARLAGLESVSTFTFLSELGKIRAFKRPQIEAAVAAIDPSLKVPQSLHQDWINDGGMGYKVLGIYRAPDFRIEPSKRL